MGTKWTERIRIDWEPTNFTGLATPCEIWTGALSGHGYGIVNRQSHASQYAYRARWVEERGELPADKPHLDHKCRVRCCVALDHLEPVTPAENNARGLSGPGVVKAYPMDFRAASEAAQRGEWTEYRRLLTPSPKPRRMDQWDADPVYDGQQLSEPEALQVFMAAEDGWRVVGWSDGELEFSRDDDRVADLVDMAELRSRLWA